uniref:adenylate cyclase n=1 Tax=Clastoptera arizonana TaxID=38151 RepID=A0A1B6CK75_9HEMI
MSEESPRIHPHNSEFSSENNRQHSVSFSREKDEINFKSETSGENIKEDDIQISLAPYIQAYLTDSSKYFECFGIPFPVPFERAARRSWWDPRFDSEILEGQYRQSAFPQIRLRFRYSLIYIFMVSLSWCSYLICKSALGLTDHESYRVGIIFGIFSLFTLFILLFTQSNLYQRFHLPVSIMTSTVMFALSLVSVGTISVLTPVGDFSLCIEILMIMYTVIPLPLYVCVILGVSYSVLFEFFIGSAFTLTPRILCHICVHLVGVHILVMTNVRMRGTFMKVGQSLLVRRQLEMEKQLKEKMIHSVMPPKVADWLMSEAANNGKDGKQSLQNEGDIKSLFRPFNMHRMEDVSILFADIVGFTKMSSTKTAEQLVSILNDLFERFDDLCAANGCEKISTLGDCYYCVSGCPEPRKDHAVCCVEMGLGMIRAIGEFDRESNEGVNMRVGIHTGTVLCGIVGTRRVKFDVWSNDVTLANRMESTGKPGQVHLSENTIKFLGDDYIFEEGDVVQGIKTYFVKGRHSIVSSNQSTLALPVVELSSSQILQNNRRSSISLATVISIHINQTAVFEEVLNNSRGFLSPEEFDNENPLSPILHDKNRLTPHPEIIRSNSNPSSSMLLPPRSKSPVQRILRISDEGWKATSLPSILDTENGDAETKPIEDKSVFSQRSLACSGVFSNKSKSNNWKYIKVNTEEIKTDDGTKVNKVSSQSEPQSPVSEKGEIYQLEMPREDQTSVCLSVYSRKDSGIRSNSRRSSIQHQLFVINGLTQGDQHRVSGYYTSSQSSLNNDAYIKGTKLPPPPSDHFCVLQKLRKQSDLQLIQCVQDNTASQRSYFVKPPLYGFSLFFRQEDMEREFRQKAHRAQNDCNSTLATARFNTYLDITVALVVNTVIIFTNFQIYIYVNYYLM